MPLNVCIFGVSGYTGSKLLSYLIKHKHVNISAVFGHNSIGKNLTELFPNISELSDLKITSFNDFKFENVDLIFSCLPHGKFQNNIISNLDLNIPIIDLSGDFRLEDKMIYEDFYNIKHKNFNLKKKFVYGLSEVYRNQISEAKYICNPGCYPTSILIPLIPLLKEKVIKSGHIIIDSKSGVSGAGKKLVETNLLSELNNNFYSYSVEKHKHFPEINQELMKINEKVSFTFIPHLLPVFSGLQSNIYIDYDGDKIKDIQNILSNYYSKEPFVKLNFKDPEKLSNVQGTNNISINVFSDYKKKRIMIISCLDNLIKGAAGQAIQNMNIMFNFEETQALL